MHQVNLRLSKRSQQLRVVEYGAEPAHSRRVMDRLAPLFPNEDCLPTRQYSIHDKGGRYRPDVPNSSLHNPLRCHSHLHGPSLHY